jgi:two-component system, LytTR family, sensor kinase
MGRFRAVWLPLVGWTVMGLLFALPDLQGSLPWHRAILRSMTSWWAWGIVAWLMVIVDSRLPVAPNQLGSRIVWHLPLSIAFTILYAYLMSALAALLGNGDFRAVFTTAILLRAMQGMLLWSLLVYWMILGGWLAKQYYQRYLLSELQRERMERLTTEARMHALRLQLDPHFLFNTLNTISSQVESDPKLARAMIEHLGNLLRMSLESNEKQHVPLTEELNFLDHYLAIQRIRFGARLRVEQVIADAARQALVPSMLIQPLVENSIRHGLSMRAAGGSVKIIAAVSGRELSVLVEDDGAGLAANHREGRGLSVTRQRLSGFYPAGQSSLSVAPREQGGVRVEILLPLVYASDAT